MVWDRMMNNEWNGEWGMIFEWVGECIKHKWICNFNFGKNNWHNSFSRLSISNNWKTMFSIAKNKRRYINEMNVLIKYVSKGWKTREESDGGRRVNAKITLATKNKTKRPRRSAMKMLPAPTNREHVEPWEKGGGEMLAMINGCVTKCKTKHRLIRVKTNSENSKPYL